MHVDRRLLGWGLFFILVGGIPLAVRTGALDASLLSGWPQLWPLLLIGWGVGLLLRGSPLHWVGGALVAITFGVMGGGLLVTGASGLSFATGCTGNGASTAFPDRTGTFDASAEVDLTFNCGSLAVTSGEGSGWSITGSDQQGLGPRLTTTSSKLSAEGDETSGFGSTGRAVWNVILPSTPSIDFGVTLNAGEGSIDLKGASITSTSFTVNAGKVDMDLAAAAQLGDVHATVNAGAAAISLPGGDRSVGITVNAGSLQMCLPADAAVKVSWGGALGSNNFSAAGLTKVDDSTWTSPGFSDAQPHTELRASATAGSFDLRLGGTCHA